MLSFLLHRISRIC